MSYTAIEAALIALKEIGQPVSSKELTDYILQHKLWETSGQTPDATIAARMYVDIKNNPETSLFTMTDRGIFALKEWNLSLQIHCNIAELVIKILKRSSKPLSKQEITQQLIAEKLWTPNPNFTSSPDDIIAAMIYGYMKKAGSDSEIYKVDRGIFAWRHPNTNDNLSTVTDSNIVTDPESEFSTDKFNETIIPVEEKISEKVLTEKEPLIIEEKIYHSNDKVKKILRDKLINMNPAAFERLIGQLLRAMGFQAEVTKYVRDNGIDVRGELVIDDVIKVKMSVQAKRYKIGVNVSAPTVQQLRGSVKTVELERGLIITTSDFTKEAYKEAEEDGKTNIALMNGEKLVELLLKYEIGVKSQKVYTIDQSAFANFE
ncbi:MAG: restriction endonuclease [Candidatus Bruticola sp.]